MITLAAADTLAASADAATDVTSTLWGDEITTTDNYKVLDQRQLAIAAATVYTVPGATSTLITSWTFSNTSAGSRTVTLYRGGTAAANELASFVIPTNGSASFDGLHLEARDSNGNTTVSIPLSTATPQPVGTAAQATPGTVGVAADAGHIHGSIATATPQAVALAGAAGSAGTLSDSGHAHATHVASAHMTTTQTVSGTAVAGTAITALNIALPLASTVYEFEADLDAAVSATSATAFGIGITVPTGATLFASILGSTNATAYRNAFFTAAGTCQASFITTTSFTGPVLVKGVVSMSTATGSMQVVCNAVGTASNTAATATIQTGSYISANPIN